MRRCVGGRVGEVGKITEWTSDVLFCDSKLNEGFAC